MMKKRARQSETEEKARMEMLLCDLKRTKSDLTQAYNCFDQVCEAELVEASIYEINALRSRCNYLIRKIKEQSAAAAAQSGKGEAKWV